MRRGDAGGCEIGAFAVNSVIEMLGERVIDDTDEGFEVVGEGEGDRDVWMSVHEVGGSIYRVDYEGWGRREAARCGGFFA